MDLIELKRLLGKWSERVEITYTSETGSTSDDLKAAALRGAADFSVRIADRQTKGRGREGKTFESPSGLYMSLLLPYSPETVPFLTHLTAIAVARAVRDLTGEDARIKWVNDVYVRGKKICGILTECIAAGDQRRVIVGIGVNANTPPEDFPAELRAIAGAISADRTALAARILSELFGELDDFSEDRVKRDYRELCFLLGERVSVIKKEGGRDATVLDLDDNLGLIVRYDDGSLETLIAGEVSLKRKTL